MSEYDHIKGYIQEGEFYKCLTCGVVSNYEESIKSGLCHRDTKQELTDLLKEMDVSNAIMVLRKLSKEDKELIKKFI